MKGAHMPPNDPTPLGDAMTHRFPQQKIPQPQPGSGVGEQAPHRVESDAGSGDDSDGAQPTAREQFPAEAADIAERPPLPEHPQRMAADIEDEEADPVIDSGPGIADGITPPHRQRG